MPNRVKFNELFITHKLKNITLKMMNGFVSFFLDLGINSVNFTQKYIRKV